MRKFWYATGELIEVQRYINVPLHWCEQYPARERREFWLRRTDLTRQEVKFVVHSRSMPARCGHVVRVLLHGDMVVGLVNLTTGKRVNFVREDPPLLLRRCDVAVALCVLVTGCMLAVHWDLKSLLWSVPLGLLHVPSRVLGRWLWRMRLRARVERGIEMALAAGPAELPRLWRIK